MHHSLSLLGLSFVALAFFACGDTGDAEDLSSSNQAGAAGAAQDAQPPDSGTPDADTDIAAPDAPPEATPEASPDVIPQPPDPFAPPAVEVATWRGKLPPAGLFDPEVEISYPTEPPPADGYPLVVFAHGFQVGEEMYRATMEHVAKFGYVAVSTDYENNPIDQDHHAPVEAMARAIDMMTTDPPSEIGAIVDPDRIAAMGHSIGGKGAVWLTLEDPRVQVLVALDPIDDDPSPVPLPTGKRPSLAPELMGDLTVPTFYLAAELSPNGAQPCAPAASNSCRYFESTPAGTPAWIAVLEDFGHMQYLDPYDCLLCGTCERGPQAEHADKQTMMRGLAVAFLEMHLRGETGHLAYFEGASREQLESDDVLLDPAEQEAFCAKQ